MAQTFNLFLDQGTTFTANIRVLDLSGSAKDLTGYTARSQFRRSVESNTATSFVATIPVGTDGNVTLSLSANVSSNVKAGRYFYDVEVVSSANVIERASQGILVIDPEITR
jgi:hypothetical protein